MNPSTPTYPIKSIKIQGHKSATSVSSGTILDAHLRAGAVHGTVWHKGQPVSFTTTLTMAQLIAGWPSINVNVKVASGQYLSTYISSGSVARVYSEGGKTILDLSHGLDGIPYDSIVVSETVAQVLALLAAAASGGTGQQVTTSATAVVVNQSNVNVVTVTSPGQVVQLSDLFPETLIINSSASYFLVKPPTGAAIDTLSTNAGIRVLGYSIVRFNRMTSLSWVSAVQKQSAQTYASALTATATVVTAQVALLSTSATALTNFYEYGDATTGEIPAFGRWTNTSSATTAKVKFAGGFIDGTGTLGGTAIATPYEIPAGCTVNFAYSHALGKVIATGNDVIRGTATLVLGAFTFDATSIGTANASRISASSRVSVTGISSTNAGTLATRFLPTIVANASIVIQGYDAAGASLATDVSTIYYEIHL